MITHARLHQVLRYDPETGKFFWLVRNSNRITAGEEAGAVAANGYRYIGIDGKRCLAHRLAWLYVHGNIPNIQIDHKDGDRLNNRIDNLRLATTSQNTINGKLRVNNSSGMRGVRFDTAKGLWRAEITLDRKATFLGRFKTKEAAQNAYVSAARAMHGEFARV